MRVRFFQRAYPSANTVLLLGPRPILVDPGSGPEVDELLGWLRAQGVDPGGLALAVNTHWHVDHSGANGAIQGMGVRLAAPGAEAAAIAAGDPDMCRAWWLRQAMQPYTVDRALAPGDVVEGWEVVALPGHTAAQVGLFADGVLVAGDALHEADVGWVDVDADPAALDQAEATLGVIERLGPRLVLSGHGPAVTDVAGALARGRRRLAGFREDPRRMAWHAAKRIFTHGLMMEGGLARGAVEGVLLDSPWVRDLAGRAFGVGAGVFVPMLLAEMLRAGAARWEGDVLVPAGAYRAPAP